MTHRLARRDRIAQMDPETEYSAIVQIMLDYDFSWDLYRALELAMMRTFAVPSIGRLLHRTGEFRALPQKRYDDSVLLIFAMLYHGSHQPEGRGAASRVNHIHGHYRISNEDFLYTLSTFVVVPVRWLQDFGWRNLHPHEVRALTLAVIDMGRSMGIERIPSTYEEFERLFDAYERAKFAYAPENEAVARSMLALAQSWVPRGLRRLALVLVLAFLDRPMRDALGLSHPPRVLTSIVRGAVRLRGQLVRFMPARREERPFVLTTRTYPNGHRLDELGPHRILERLHEVA
ncbi:MAG TPA: oxygenase MpaB family protein [Nocardioidaceae bacterium]|nr:oxygenase MpaB family protein [Nocardioidaceae bacterium]